MSKIYEALTKVEELEHQAPGPSSTKPEVRIAQRRSTGEVLAPVRREENVQRLKELVEPVDTTPLGTVGQGAVDEKVVTFVEPQSVTAEQFRKIRTVLSHLRMSKGYRSIMITSALPGEGKSLTACNLGVAITQGLDDKAFLIDCDLRSPGVHQLFAFNGKPGLGELLEGKKELSQVIHEIEGLGLRVIPAGRKRPNPAELLSSEKMARFLKELKAEYENHYIILDATPVLLTAETGALARHVDGILLVIRFGKTSKDLVKRAMKEIPREKVIGVILNGVEPGKGYYAKYQYGYGHP